MVNDGKLQMYHIQDDHEAIIDIDTWDAVQQEIARREKYCEEHRTNAYAQLTETKPLSCKVFAVNAIIFIPEYSTPTGMKGELQSGAALLLTRPVVQEYVAIGMCWRKP